MKNRILRLLRKNGDALYCLAWRKGTKTYDSTLQITNHYQEWVYFEWAGMVIHFNVLTDKITIFVDERLIACEG